MSKTKSSAPSAAVLILAAGLGKRMKSTLPKVLHEVCGEPMLIPLLRSVSTALAQAISNDGEKGAHSVGIIVGHGREQVESAVGVALEKDASLRNLNVSFLVQAEQKGTGHAVQSAMKTPWGDARIAEKSAILVLPGDSPLIPTSLIAAMISPLEKKTAIRLLTCEVPDPKGYGRILRKGMKPGGPVLRIVEEKDASPRERAIREVAASTYLFDSKFLSLSLPKLTMKNAQGEYYLTDLIEMAGKGKNAQKVATLVWSNSDDLRGVNDLWELALAERVLQLRIVERHARNGVRFLDPYSVALENSVRIGEGVRIHRGVVLRGQTVIGNGVDIGSNTVLRNTRVDDAVVLKAGCYCENSVIEAGAKVGPYAHLRPASLVGKNAKIGNFVELKNATIGEGTSVAHLSYLGDAKVGAGVNIGCGFVTCNFDGRVKNGSRKHITVIEDGAFIGSDCQAVAPLTVGQGAFVASGSTLTKDVPADALAIARPRQENKLGYAKKLRSE